MSSQLTRIHDKYYDLKDFQHPGGQMALACAYQRDATELLYSYHQFKDLKKIFQILEKYEVPINDKCGVVIEKKSIFNWEEALASPFYTELRQALDPYFATNGTKMNSQRVCEVLLLFLITCSQYFFLLKGYYFSLITFPITLFLFVANIAHDASHFAVSETPWLNELACELIVFITPKYYWMNQHVIGHHCYTNVPEVDPDISVPVYRHHPDLPHLPVHSFQPYFPFIMPALRVPVFYLVSIWRCFQNQIFLGGHQMTDSPALSRWSMISAALGFIFPIYIVPLITLGLNMKGLIFSFLPAMVFNYYYMTISGLGHNLLENHSQSSPNFFIHQIITAHDFSTQSYIAYLLSGALNCQIEHHLLPVSILSTTTSH
jgi:fatty acid desaturase